MKYNNILLQLLPCRIISKRGRKEIENNDDSKTAKRYLLQFAATISVCLLSFMGGCLLHWTSSALPFLESEDSEIHVTQDESSWIASILDIGLIPGHLMMPFLSPFIGRKPCLLFAALPLTISWILIIFAKNVSTLYIARFIAGTAAAFSLGFSLIYLGEIADKNIRGKLMLIRSLSIHIGSLSVKTAGAFLSYKMTNILMLCPLIIFFCTFIFMPESPYYLLLKNREQEAINILMKLQMTKNQEIISSDFERVKNAVQESQKIKHWAFRDLLFVRKNRKSFCIVMISFLTIFLSGASTIAAYTQEIFDYSGISLAPEYCAMILPACGIISCVASSPFVELAGRRKMFVLSGIFSAIGLGMVGLFFFIKYYLEGNITSITWLPLAGLIITDVAASFGITYIPFVVMGEMFDINVKVTALVVINVIGDSSMFLITFLFKFINSTYGIYVNFWMYTVFCIIGTLLFFIIAPETQGKSLEDIQEILSEKENSNINIELL